MSPCDTEYFRNRAASERANAAVASSVVAEIHLELARRYEQLLGDESHAVEPIGAPFRQTHRPQSLKGCSTHGNHTTL